MTPEERQARSRAAAQALWAKTPDRAARTAPARAAFMKKFEDQVDPDRIMSEAERAFMAEEARRAHYRGIALKGVEARRRKAWSLQRDQAAS